MARTERLDGSAELAVTATSEGRALILPDYNGIRFDRITSLSYWTLRQTADVGNNLAVALQFNVDYDLDDNSTAYQGRLVFEPYVGIGGNVPSQTWQAWDAHAGRWWGTRSSVTVNDALVVNPCVQSTPCTWNQLLAAFDRVGVHDTYGAVVLKAGSGWGSFRGNVDKLTIGVDGVETTFDFERDAPPAIPATAPGSPPFGLLHPARVLSSPDSLQIPVFADLIEVEFVAETPLAEREAAIWSVDGTVVGGFDTGDVEDTYSVLLPADSSGATMRDAVLSLKSRPSVRRARVELAISNALTYRRPNDGVGLKRADWKLDPGDAFVSMDTATWAASAVAAPFAWGCSTGNGVLLATIDMGHAFNVEFAGRINSESSTFRRAETSAVLNHGQAVAAVAAASMNNGVGVAGLASESELLLLDVGAFDSTTMRLIPDSSGAPTVVLGYLGEAWQAILRAKPRVINVSLGGDSVPSASTDSIYRDFVSQIKAIVESPSQIDWDPLFVVSAGNAGSIGRHDWGVLGSLADSMPSRVLVVGAAERQLNTPSAQTSTGGIVDIYAPGVMVAVFDSVTNSVSYRTGSSFATPLVAGAAAMLFSFDPRLTSAEVRGLLLSGATPSRDVAGKPFLDAYGSLRLASGRPKAPLCGVRSWGNDSGQLMVQRRGGPELVLPTGADPYDAAAVNIHHGGKRIERAFWERSIWTKSGWTPGSWSTDTISEYSASFKSSGAWYQDHDDEIYTTVSRALVAGGVRIDVRKSPVGGGTPTQVPAVTVGLQLMAAVDTICLRESMNSEQEYQCSATVDSGQRVFLRDMPTVGADVNGLHAIDPQGKFVVVPLVTRRQSMKVSQTWIPCSGPAGTQFPSIRCRSVLYDSTTTVSAQIIRVDLTTGQPMTWLLPATGGSVPFEPTWLAITDDSRELILQVMGYRKGGGSVSCENSRHLWLTMVPAAGTLTSAFTIPLTGTALCDGSLTGSASLRLGSP